jgi:hypothetical protein
MRHLPPQNMMFFAGWGFGTFFNFPYIGNVIIPTDFHIFQRGGSTTNQFVSENIGKIMMNHWGVPQTNPTAFLSENGVTRRQNYRQIAYEFASGKSWSVTFEFPQRIIWGFS